MNFYLLLLFRNIEIIDGHAYSRPLCRVLSVYHNPDKKLYDIYFMRDTNSYETLFNWPRKKIPRLFISKIFSHKTYLTSINSDSMEELIDKVKAQYGETSISTIIK